MRERWLRGEGEGVRMRRRGWQRYTANPNRERGLTGGAGGAGRRRPPRLRRFVGWGCWTRWELRRLHPPLRALLMSHPHPRQTTTHPPRHNRARLPSRGGLVLVMGETEPSAPACLPESPHRRGIHTPPTRQTETVSGRPCIANVIRDYDSHRRSSSTLGGAC